MADGFLPLPRFMLSATWAQRITYAWILYRAELSPDGACMEDSLRGIAKATGLAPRSVPYALDQLVAAGLLQRDSFLPGEVGQIRLLLPPAHRGDAKVAEYPMQKWPLKDRSGGAKMAVAVKEEHGPKYKVQRRQKRVDQVEIQTNEIEHIARRVFQKSGYSGDEGGNLWKLGALLHTGRIAECELWDACTAADACQARDPAAYIYAVVKDHLARRGLDLQAELAKIRLVPDWPTSPPNMDHHRETAAQDVA